MEKKERDNIPKISSKSLQNLTRCLPEACLVTDTEGKVLEANEQTCSLLNFEKGELLKKTAGELFSKPTQELISELTGEGGEPKHSDQILKIDEKEIPIKLKSKPILIEDEEKFLLILGRYYEQDESGVLYGKLNTPQVDPDSSKTEHFSSRFEKALEWQEALFEGSRDAIFVSDEDANFVAVNESACELTGYSRGELMDMRIPDLHEESDLDAFKKYHDKIMDGEDVLCETKILRKDGKKIDVELNNSRIIIGDVPYLHTTARDVTKHQQLEDALTEERNRLRELHKTAHKIYECEGRNEACKIAADAAENILDLESCEIFLLDGDSLLPKAYSLRSFKEKAQKVRFDKELAKKTLEKDKIFLGRNDDIPEVDLTIEKGQSVISVPIGDQGTFQAISTTRDSYSKQEINLAKLLVEHLRETLDRIDLEEELREQSTRDPLTDLYNRRYFNETLKHEIERSKRDGYKNGFLMIDVNRFKEINDRYSHQIGDEVLQEVAKLLKDNVRSTDTVVRFGGDEFLIMLVEVDSGVVPTADRIRKAVKEWNEESSLLDFPLTLAIGATSWSPSG